MKLSEEGIIILYIPNKDGDEAEFGREVTDEVAQLEAASKYCQDDKTVMQNEIDVLKEQLQTAQTELADWRARRDETFEDLEDCRNQVRSMQKPDCIWKYMDDDWGSWDTSCGKSFCLEYGLLSANGMNYCCYCGGIIEARKKIEDEESD